jgi:autophagy-related protein 5
MEEQQVHKHVWGGLVPVQFTLAASEVATMQPPEPLYLMLPRTGYLPLFSEQVREYFSSSAPSQQDELWYDSAGTPLKWHYPIGVLFDLYCGPLSLPWNITVHFRGFPTSQLLRCQNLDTVKSYFLNSLKEANYLRHGDGSKTNSLSLAEQHELWEGLRTNDMQLYTKSSVKLVPEEGKLRSVPVRVIRPGMPPLQEPLPALDQGVPLTFAGALAKLLPADAASLPAWVHGVQPPGDTPLLWLAEHMPAPDCFLYVALPTYQAPAALAAPVPPGSPAP